VEKIIMSKRNIISGRQSAIVLSAALAALAVGSSAFAQYSITTLGTAVTENFNGATGYGTGDGLVSFPGGNGTTANLLSGVRLNGLGNNWLARMANATNGFTIANNNNFQLGAGVDPGNVTNMTFRRLTDNVQVIANGNGASGSGALRAYVNAGNTSDRALGILANANLITSQLTAAFTNSTDSVANSLVIQYTGRTSRIGERPSLWSVAYSLDGVSYTPIGGLTYATPFGASAGNAGVPVNGWGQAGNVSNGGTPVNMFATVNANTPVPSGIAAGSTFFVRWQYVEGGTSGTRSGISIDDLSVTLIGGAAAKNITWSNGQGTFNWNTTDTNWIGDGTTFADGDLVTFNGTAPGTVTIRPAGVVPSNVNITAGSYTFAGGPINGAASVTFTGGGILTLAATNGFSGGVRVSGGSTVQPQVTGAVGTGNVVLDNGILQATSSLTLPGVVAAAGGGVVDVAAGATVTLSGTINGGPIAAPTAFRKTGDGVLAVTGALSGFNLLSVEGGQLRLNAASGSRSIYVSTNWEASTAGDFVIGGPFRINLIADPVNGFGNGGFGPTSVGASSTTGKLIFNSTAILASQQIPSLVADRVNASIGANVVYDLNLQVDIGSGNAVGLGASGSTLTADFNTLNINKPISGSGKVYFGVATASGGNGTNYASGGLGLVALNSQSTFSGVAHVTMTQTNTVAGSLAGVVRQGVNNSLPVDVRLALGDDNITSAIRVGFFDLGGFNLTVGSVSSSAAAGFVGGIANTGGAADLIIAGPGSATYAGPIGQPTANALTGSNRLIAVRKSGSGTQTLTGTLNYSLGTFVTGGQLNINTPGNFSASEYNVSAQGVGAVVSFGAPTNPATTTVITPDTLSVTSGGVARLAVTDRAVDKQRVLVLPSLLLDGVSLLDLGNGDAVLPNLAIGAVRGLIATNLADPAVGLGASASGTGGRFDFARLGARLPVDAVSGLLEIDSFSGVTVGVNDVLVKFTYAGDVNLDGTLDATDFNAVLNGLTNNLTGWDNGDVNYDNVVNGTDWSLFLAAYNYVAANPGQNFGNGGPAGAIPEPTSLALLAAPIALLARRRR
jgi:autotransporter-associated beta strand protein